MNTESEFLDAYSPSDFDRPSVAVDVAIVTVVDDSLGVLLVRRDSHPHSGSWQLPGGFLGLDESLEEAAARILAEKANMHDVFIEQLFTFGQVDRDPRTRVLSVCYYALVEPGRIDPDGPGQVAVVNVPWEGETGGSVTMRLDAEELAMAFDHQAMVGMVVKRLRGKLNYSPVGYELLPDEFTLLDLQRIHEIILGRALNKDSFRRRMLASNELNPTGRRRTGVGHRPAELYRKA